MATLRAAELNRLFHDRYGPELPDDDAGRDDARIMAHHLAALSRDQRRRILEWLTVRASWLPKEEAEALADAAIAKPIRWKADTLAKRLNLTAVDRERLAIRTIGAVDQTKAEREAERQQRKTAAKAAKRLSAGARPHKHSARRTRPWQALKISRATWYRKRQLLAA